MERLTETSLLEVTGGLMISSLSEPVSVVHVPQFFQNTVAAAKKFGIKHDLKCQRDASALPSVQR